ncbi:oligosaccharide flippase family protein [Planctomycetota bacterium]
MTTNSNSPTVELDASPAEKPVSLRQKVVQGTKWNLFGQAFGQGWRLAANLIVAQLVAPDAFGIMLMINVFVFSVQMLSDVGLRDAVIHNDHGDEPRFLNTVWTIQIIRGFALWGIICIGTVPFANFYGVRELYFLLPVAGLTAAIRGLCSTSLLTAGRHIHPAWTVTTEIVSSVSSSLVTIAVAVMTHNVWALVIGQVMGAVFFSAVSYRFGHHRNHRFQWDREAARAVSSFGRWVIPSSTLTILLRRGDSIVLGKVMDTTTLGVYSIGANLALMWVTVYGQMASSILHPVYSKTRKLPIQEARTKIRKLRFAICGACLAGIWAMIGLSYWFFALLYKPEFLNAYIFCQVVAFGITLRVTTDMGPVFQAHGMARRHFILVCIRSAGTVLAMFLGYVLAGFIELPHAYYGVLWGAALSPLIFYPIQCYMYRQIDMWFPEIDAMGVIPAVGLVIYGLF